MHLVAYLISRGNGHLCFFTFEKFASFAHFFVASCYHMPHLPACKFLLHTGNAYSSPFLLNPNEPVTN